MRVAICLSGHMRFWQHCRIQLCEKIICANPQHAFDIFIHTWSEVSQNAGPISDDDVSHYESISYVIEHPKEWDTSKYFSLPQTQVKGGTRGEHILSMFYKIERCHELMKRHAATYDLVVRSRPDICFDAPFNLDQFTNADAVYVQGRASWLPTTPSDDMGHQTLANFEGRIGNGLAGINDCVAVATPTQMEKYATLYSRIDHLCKKYQTFAPEALAYHNLWDQKVKIEPFTDVFHVWRGNDMRDYPFVP